MTSVFTHTTLLLLSASWICLCTALICPAIDFDAYADAESLLLALHANNERAITDILTGRSSEQRAAILDAYYHAYNGDLVSDCKNVLWGDYKDLIVAMVKPLSYYYAEELYYDSRAFATQTNAVTSILMTSSNAFMKDIDDSYTQLYEQYDFSLNEDLKTRIMGLPTGAIEGQIDRIRDETQEVYEDQLNTDVEVFRKGDKYPILRILIYRSFKHLHRLIKKYEELYDEDIEKAIDGWSVDATSKGARNIIRVHRSVPEHFASRLHYTMSGLGTCERELNRIIVGRSEIDLDDIKDAFEKNYSESLASWIVDDTSGEYMRALLIIINSKCSYQYCKT